MLHNKYLHLLLVAILFVLNSGQPGLAQTRPKVGIVLSGGGAKGFAHIGVLKVLEEAGMPIDYIGGTSMGSIIGGLYALGYNADSLDKVVSSLDWAELLTDKIPRRYLAIDQKEYEGKYFFPYPVSNGKFQMPSSMVAGQNFETLLSRLMWNRMDSCDFSTLPIPFLCIATDLEHGKAVIMRNGNLTSAIRASMSIPTLFAPKFINGHIYVDGGIYNNFPVKEVRNMGADIIIGVDVGFEPFPASELNSMLRIIEQSVFTHTIEKNKENRKLCNVLVMPDLHKYSMMNFDNVDSLIHCGEIAARAQFGRIKKLADSIKALGYVGTKVKVDTQKVYKISNVKVVGFKKIPRTYIISKLNIKVPSAITCEEVEEGINKIYGTLLFQKVNFRFNTSYDYSELIVEVEEKPQSVFSLGINYNTDYRASIYFNTSFYNVLLNGSKLSVDALLGENPRINSTFYLFSGWNPKGLSPVSGGWRFDFGINLNTSHYDLLNYYQTWVISKFGYTDISSTIYAQTTLKNSYAWGIGLQSEFTSRKADINPFNAQASTVSFFNIVSFVKFDTYNRSNFPNKGVQLNIEGKYLTNLYDHNLTPGGILNLKYGIAIPLSKRVTLCSDICGGVSLIDSLPETYMYRLGGVATYYVKNAFSFSGFKLLEVAAENIGMARLKVQTELFSKNFVIFSCNMARYSNDFRDLVLVNKNVYGYCLTYGYNSIIGPIEFSVMKSPKHNLMAYLNVGFWF